MQQTTNMTAINSKKQLLFTAGKLGFCNGVRRALEAVENILRSKKDDQLLYIYNEIVHNTFIVNDLKKRGVVFVTSLDEIPDAAMVVWSAHGVPPELEQRAKKRNLRVTDATCPLVKRLHDLASEYSLRGDAVIFIGHAGHPETVGVLGCGNIYCVSSESDCCKLPDFPENKRISLLTQTTLCRSEIENILQKLQQKYPQLEVAGGICYATAERQQAVRDLIEQHNIERLIVIGSPRSSNSNRLCDTARQYNIEAILVDDPAELEKIAFDNISRLGLTAGASAPEILLDKARKILIEKHNFQPC